MSGRHMTSKAAAMRKCPHIVIFTEAGKTHGFGHLTRCVALAEAILSRCHGARVNCFVRGGDLPCHLAGHRRIHIEANDWLSPRCHLSSLISFADCVIVDSYDASSSFFRRLDRLKNRKRRPIIAVINDITRPIVPADVWINPSIYGEKLAGPMNHGMVRLLGKKYILLQKPYWKVPASRIKANISRVLVTLGGTARAELLSKIFSVLDGLRFSLCVTIVCGTAPKWVSKNNLIKLNTKDFQSAAAMKKVMLKSDLCISGCGQTLHELARCGIPTIGVRLASNQRWNALHWERLGFLGKVLWERDRNFEVKLEQSFNDLLFRKRRRELAEKGTKLVDGSGALRVAKVLLALMVRLKLRPAEKNDCRVLYRWRNHPEVRKNSFQTKTIDYDSHCEWFENILHDAKVKTYVAETDRHQRVGVIRFNKSSGSFFVNVALNPLMFNNAIGFRLIKMGTENFLAECREARSVIAKIKTSNTRSQEAFRRAGYCLLKRSQKEKIVTYRFKNARRGAR